MKNMPNIPPTPSAELQLQAQTPMPFARQPGRSGLLLGLYYGGTGFGIVLSALLVPLALAAAQGQPHGWSWGWWAMALLCAGATALLAWPAPASSLKIALPTAPAEGVPWKAWLG